MNPNIIITIQNKLFTQLCSISAIEICTILLKWMALIGIFIGYSQTSIPSFFIFVFLHSIINFFSPYKYFLFIYFFATIYPDEFIFTSSSRTHQINHKNHLNKKDIPFVHIHTKTRHSSVFQITKIYRIPE